MARQLHSSVREGNMKLAKVLGYMTLATLVAGLVVTFSDIRRYIRISTM
jgi:hypothetical protein